MVRKALPAVIFFVAVFLQLNLPRYYASTVESLRAGPSGPGPKSGRVDELAIWFGTRLRPDDTVQPLDWADGAIHAMLIARARLATEFMYEYHFYHHHVIAHCTQFKISVYGPVASLQAPIYRRDEDEQSMDSEW